jgi:hypothetical protein
VGKSLQNGIKSSLAQKMGGMLREIRESKKSCKTAQKSNLGGLSVPMPKDCDAAASLAALELPRCDALSVRERDAALVVLDTLA